MTEDPSQQAEIMITDLDSFLEEVRRQLLPSEGYEESPDTYLLRCPSGKCGDKPTFLLTRANGSGVCQNDLHPAGEPRRYSLWAIARLLGIDTRGLYEVFADPQPAKLPDTETARAGDSLLGLRGDTVEAQSEALLEDPSILERFLRLASAFGIANEINLLRVLCLVVVARLLGFYRVHASLGELFGAGKSELARFVILTLPISAVLHLGGGASKRAFQYFGDLSRMVIFIDEADALDEELRAFLREAVTKSQVTRLVTMGDPGSGFSAERQTVETEGMVLIQAGTRVIENPADESRFLVLHPDVSREQTDRILDRQAESAATISPSIARDLEVWRGAQESLQPCTVVIPFAREIRKFMPSDQHRIRRDFPRLLSLIAANACLHQRQRSCYEEDGHLVVEAELADYVGIYEFVAPLFAEATKGLTPTQEKIIGDIRQHRQKGQGFTTYDAMEWTESAYSTVRGHLQDLEDRGMVESRKDRGKVIWSVVADAPPGISLPSPADLIERVTHKPSKRSRAK